MSNRKTARWLEVGDAAALRLAAYRRIIDAAERAIKARGQYLIVLAGGNTPRGVYELLATADAEWSRWHVYFADERCLPATDPDRNSQMAYDAWLDHVPIPFDQVHPIEAERGAEVAARAYAQLLRGVGNFDLVLLGLGDDGHTASLFPDHEWGAAPDAADVLAVPDSPKPPPQRVSLSAARLSRSREVLFLVAGETKRDMLKLWRMGAAIPASAIEPTAGVDVLIA